MLSTEAVANLRIKYPDMDSSKLQAIALAIFKEAPIQKQRRKAKEVSPDERCMARMWRQDPHDDDGNYVYGQPSQCSRRHKDGRFCGQHGKAHSECSTPLQFTHSSAKDFKRLGLFHGAIDEELPFHDADGHIVIYWNDSAVKEWVAEQKEAGTYAEHPAWTSAGGNLWLGGTGEKQGSKKGDPSKAKKKNTKSSVASAIGVKKKRGLTPYFCFLEVHRATIRADLEAAEKAEAASEGREVKSIRIGPITKEAGVRWTALKEDVEEDKDGADAEMASYVTASSASKAKAAEANAAAETEAMGSLDEQIAKLQALKAAADDTDVDVLKAASTLLSFTEKKMNGAVPTHPPSSKKKLKVKAPPLVVAAPAPPIPPSAPSPTPTPTLVIAAAAPSPTPTPTQPSEEVIEEESEAEEGEAEEGEAEEVIEEEGEAEEFQHGGETLWKLKNPDGSWRVFVADEDGTAGEDFYDWGTISADGVITEITADE